MESLTAHLLTLSPITLGLLGSLVAGLGTGIGALPMYVAPRLTPRAQDLLLGLSAGIMLAATFFSLLLPGLESVAADSLLSPPLVMFGGILLGAAGLWFIHKHVPHEHLIMGHDGPEIQGIQRMWLIVFAITLHNFPEGLAVGVGFGGPDLNNAIVLMIGIGLQNMPEGLVVAVALLAAGYSRTKAFLLALLTGLVEPVGGLVGVTAVGFADALLPWGLAVAAGAMLFVISNEIIPETHRRGNQAPVTFTLLAGFGLMMVLDQALGA
ncbi:MAG: ZIP family metal transporter [Gammaproteobacteria bacterium]|nr:ZIP family metal transporter [Gammaproteobacteria bacterium]MDX5374201.1 ZIP family metal transporter [Gammaproteobacteria bacterium]